ncbi:MAG: lasso RiPP family leader peptide-containing protein [Myxococcales bacterium]|nr:lasso RiPP family leader peptide-containing protein [Myxococcales bacterium]
MAELKASARKPYRKPQLAELGSVVELTLGAVGTQSDGGRTLQP